MRPAIFDFDCTLTVHHTFAQHAISDKQGYDQFLMMHDQYAIGKEEGKKNIKHGLDLVFQHDEHHLSAIATYHNNPDFVAGVVSVILNKELSLLHRHNESIIILDSLLETNIALSAYQVEGEDKPFFISYIPYAGHEFQHAIDLLKNKNDQIDAIRDRWLLNKLVKDSEHIDFYEDSSENFHAAKSLGYINGHLVTRDQEHEVSESYKATTFTGFGLFDSKEKTVFDNVLDFLSRLTV